MFQVDGEPTPSGMGRPRRLPDVREFAVGADLLLYPRQGQAVVAINPFAKAVWKRCDGSATIFEISQELASFSDPGSNQRFLDVEATVMHLFKEGLLEFEEQALQAHSNVEGGQVEVAEICVGLEEQQVIIQSNLPEVLDRVDRRFNLMLVSNHATKVSRLEVRLEDGVYLLSRNGASVRQDRRLVDSLYYLEGEIIQSFMASRPELIWFHAGASEQRGRAVLIVGPAGAGKSTIVSRLCASGWTYLSDEVAPVNVDAGLVVPFLQAPLVRETAERNLTAEKWRKLPKLEEELDPESVCREPVTLGAIVFPAFDADIPPDLSSCPESEAALSLLENCHSFGSHGDQAVQAVAEMVEKYPAFRLSYQSGQSAVRLLSCLAEELESS